MRRQKPSTASPDYQKLLIFGVLFFFALILWGVTIYIWYQAYLWFAVVNEYSFILTFLVLPIPFWLYDVFFHTDASATTSTPTDTINTPAPTPVLHPQRARTIGNGWVSWLGNGEEHRGLLVLFVIIFGSIFYWSLMYQVNPNFDGLRFAFVFSAWGLITVIGTIMIRTLFIRQTSVPGSEVPAAGAEKKSAK